MASLSNIQGHCQYGSSVHMLDYQLHITMHSQPKPFGIGQFPIISRPIDTTIEEHRISHSQSSSLTLSLIASQQSSGVLCFATSSNVYCLFVILAVVGYCVNLSMSDLVLASLFADAWMIDGSDQVGLVWIFD
jgi:hypothetical protein